MKWGYTLKKTLIIFALLITTALYAQNGETAGVAFHNFQWGTSLQEFKAKMGEPVNVENNNGFQSLLYDNIQISGYPVFMLAYFSRNGLEGGAYYFNTFNQEELMQCYTTVQGELLEKYGPTPVYYPILKEAFPYISYWDLGTGYVQLRVDTRRNEPVTLWYSSPRLTEMVFGNRR